MQRCLDDGRPILPRHYDAMLAAAKSLEMINEVLPQIRSLASCGFISDAFHALLDNDCDDLDDSTHALIIAALMAAVSLTLGSFLFCVCFRCVHDLVPKHKHSSQQGTGAP